MRLNIHDKLIINPHLSLKLMIIKILSAIPYNYFIKPLY